MEWTMLRDGTGRRFVICGAACACLASLPFASGRAAPVADPRGRFHLDYIGSFAATMREGATAARISADSLPARGVWAVGPTQALAGELTVVDGTAYVATISHRQVRVVEDRSAGAPFLVWAEVPRWSARPLPAGLDDQRALEAHLRALAPEMGLDPDGPFPFLLTGAPREVAWHVLGGPGPAAAGGHGGQRHGHGAGGMMLRDRPMTLVGFYSRRHEDVFTHRGEFSHIHLVTEDRALSGHVDALVPGGGLTLHLPG
jgi:acetolactate decarboxylase